MVDIIYNEFNDTETHGKIEIYLNDSKQIILNVNGTNVFDYMILSPKEAIDLANGIKEVIDDLSYFFNDFLKKN